MSVQPDLWDIHEEVQHRLGSRYWTRKQTSPIGLVRYEIGVKGPEGEFELRASGGTPMVALEDLRRWQAR